MGVSIKNSLKYLVRDVIDLTESFVQGVVAKEMSGFQFADDGDLFHYRSMVGEKKEPF